MKAENVAQTTELAVIDALTYGIGVIVVRNLQTTGLEFVYVHPRDYVELAQALQTVAQEVKGTMQ
jgi:hypothetical protein